MRGRDCLHYRVKCLMPPCQTCVCQVAVPPHALKLKRAPQLPCWTREGEEKTAILRLRAAGQKFLSCCVFHFKRESVRERLAKCTILFMKYIPRSSAARAHLTTRPEISSRPNAFRKCVMKFFTKAAVATFLVWMSINHLYFLQKKTLCICKF